MTADPTPPFKSGQYEFTDEQSRTISGLADAMRSAASLLQVLGLAFAVFFGLQAAAAIQSKAGYGPVAGLAAATLLFLALGFWTGGAATSFRKVVETKNEDLWHLMNALRTLHNLYALLRTLVVGGMVLAVVGTALVIAGMMKG